MSKQKFDLSNVGGQPKTWDEKSQEAEVASSEWGSLKLVLVPVLCGIAIIGGLGYFLISAAKFIG